MVPLSGGIEITTDSTGDSEQMTAAETQTVTAFGLIIIGSEVLDGRRQDAHFAFTRKLLSAHELSLQYALILPDDAEVITTHLRWAMKQAVPFFCCGGIGSTPDDLTRDCAADAAGVTIEPHPEGARILRDRWGADATPARMRMIDFPAGATLVPNPVNQVPGFHIRNGYFLPGFPIMAQPMMAWVIGTLPLPGEKRAAAELVMRDVREADLVAIMEQFVGDHPAVSFSSLPHYIPDGGTELLFGVSGFAGAVGEAFLDLCALLQSNAIPFEISRQPPSHE